MEIVVTGRHEGVTREMREDAARRIAKLQHVFERLTDAKVVLEANGSGCRAEASVHGPRGATLVARAEAPDMKAALDDLEHRLLTRLRKLKTRLVDRRGPGRGAA
ncbi:MAG TPA: ribosome-associated translation inhibitor RaiA [Planctomycetota bacterium]|nr:ribosome-associated translation inhibitor RaiA [Planctomycetota bacterium]